MNFNSQRRLLDPYPDYAVWRNKQPIWWADDINAWVVSRYDDVRTIMKDAKRFSSEAMGERDHEISLPLLTDDPPKHTQLRAIVNKAFTSKTLKAMEIEVRDMVDTMLNRLDTSRPVDISADFTIPLPIAVISKLMGIPFARKDDFKRWSDALTGTSSANSLEERMPQIMEMAAFFKSLIPQRRHNPGDDLISKIVGAEVDGRALEDMEIVGFNMLLLIAGNETTTNLLSNLLNYLADHREVWKTLRAEPDKIDAAVEEILRFDAPVHWVSRRATEDTVIADQLVKSGENIFVMMGSANRDESHYEDADVFRLDRAKKQDHHTFGHGIHFCIGAPLGRLEARYALTGLLDRFESISHVPDAKNERTNSSMLRGFHHLWVELS